MKYGRLLLIGLIVFFYQCDYNNELSVKVDQAGYIECFECNKFKDYGQVPLNCEASAVAFYNDKLLIASDKQFPSLSAVFEMEYNSDFPNTAISFKLEHHITQGKKFEDFSVSPDREFVLLSSGFDRYKTDGAWDGYNTLLYWETSGNSQIKNVGTSDEKSDMNSLSIREEILKALSQEITDIDPNYFKVEGIAVIPENKILFGIREYGIDYKNPIYCIKIVEASYTKTPSGITLNKDIKVVYNYVPKRGLPIKTPIALSSIEYDPYNDCLWLLTSYEFESVDYGIGGYLWTIKLPDLYEQKAPEIIRDKNRDVIHFAHKTEGVAVIDDSHLFIIADDDRITGSEKILDPNNQFYRTPNQAAFLILKHNM